MSNEKLYLYYYRNQSKDADRIDITADSLGLTVEKINLSERSDKESFVKGICGGDMKLFPLLQVGAEKIRAVLFKPSDSILKNIFDPDSEEMISLPKPVIYSSTWCGNCHLIRDWFTDREIKFKEINVEDNNSMSEKLTKMSGGRRVVPTVEYKGVVYLFNPNIELMGRLYH